MSGLVTEIFPHAFFFSFVQPLHSFPARRFHSSPPGAGPATDQQCAATVQSSPVPCRFARFDDSSWPGYVALDERRARGCIGIHYPELPRRRKLASGERGRISHCTLATIEPGGFIFNSSLRLSPVEIPRASAWPLAPRTGIVLLASPCSKRASKQVPGALPLPSCRWLPNLCGPIRLQNSQAAATG